MVRDSSLGHLLAIVLKSVVGPISLGLAVVFILFEGKNDAFNSNEVTSSSKMLVNLKEEKQ